MIVLEYAPSAMSKLTLGVAQVVVAKVFW